MEDTTLEYAYQYIEETGLLSGVPQTLEWYFDCEAFAKDLFLEGYCEYEGHFILFIPLGKRGSKYQMLTIIFRSKTSTECVNRCF